MKKILVLAFVFFCTASFSAAFKSQSANGSTGLFATPTAYTGWSDCTLGLDFGYHFIDGESEDTNVYSVTLQVLGKLELGVSYDDQDYDGEDTIFHGKFSFYQGGGSAVAFGGNYQSVNYNKDFDDTFYQIYLAATYSGNFFTMPAETTIVFGKTFVGGSATAANGIDQKNFDFSMGFDLDLFPSAFKGYVHWINEFSNYSYSADAIGAEPIYRACFNTGARIALLKDSRRYKLNVDAVVTDVLDDKSRDFSLGVCFGLAL